MPATPTPISRRTSVPSLLACGLLVLALALSACSRRQAEWEMARAADTVESYERFLRTFPEGEFAAQAQKRASELSEERDWKKAVSVNTLGAYQQFVAQYPDGRMSDEARIRIEGFTLAGAPDSSGAASVAAPPPAVSVANAPMAPEAQNAPANTRSSAVATAAGAAGAAYRIQLGAFTGGERQAMGEWRRLQRDYENLLTGLTPSVKLATTTTGHLYRLQAGTTSETRAREICARLQADGQACVVVLP